MASTGGWLSPGKPNHDISGGQKNVSNIATLTTSLLSHLEPARSRSRSLLTSALQESGKPSRSVEEHESEGQTALGSALHEDSRIANNATARGPLSIAQRRSSQLIPSLQTAIPAYEPKPSVSHQPPSSSSLPHSSQPITIPARQRSDSRPATPLTGREGKGGPHFPFFETTPQEPHFSQSPRPRYSSHNQVLEGPRSNTSPPKHLPSSIRTSMSRRQEQSASSYIPTSPLSPSMRSSAVPPGRSQNRAGHGLQLASLPRFHPAVYQSPTSSSVNSPVRSRPAPAAVARAPRSPQPPQRQFSDAQFKLHQHQRDLLSNASRAAHLAVAANKTTDRTATPKAPPLMPCGSPGPATPLVLEEQNDYLTSGAHIGEGSSQELVDRMIRAELERSTGINSGHSSPAVSPAGGRG